MAGMRLLFLTSIVLFVLLCGIYRMKTTHAASNRVRTITSIEIEKGDTLWGIGQEYYSEEFGDMNSYIDEIREINGLVDDRIIQGHNLIVPYYMDK